jgi:hypothetical protein
MERAVAMVEILGYTGRAAGATHSPTGTVRTAQAEAPTLANLARIVDAYA